MTIALSIAGVVLLMWITGWWRVVLSPFRISASRMDMSRLGLRVSSENAGRVSGILSSFAGGFNAMITGPRWSSWQSFCDSLPMLYRPFAHEGAAMGFVPRSFLGARPEVFEDRVVKPRPEMRYLYYVGLGFWSGMRDHSPSRIARMVSGLDPLHGTLCYDGYGFKHGFFDYLRDPGVVAKFEALEGYGTNAAYQGLGRAFWFLFMDDHAALIEHISGLGDRGRDVAGGLGLAAVFVNPDRLEVARQLGMKLPAQWHDDFHLGLCFGLKARSLTDGEMFEQGLERLEQGVGEAVRAGVRECDRIELQVRADGAVDGYRRWRSLVAQWMAGHIVYPLARVTSPAHETTSNAAVVR
ncbi:MAG: DUF1702 family protein [bacterium]|nr:DUF1702 family protein [bacterium]